MGACRLEQCTVKKLLHSIFFNFHGMVNRGVTFVLLSVDRYYICLRTVACEWENLERSMLTEACQWDGATRRVRKGVITFFIVCLQTTYFYGNGIMQMGEWGWKHVELSVLIGACRWQMRACKWERGDGNVVMGAIFL